MHVVTENNRSIGQVVSELKNDTRDFVSTRLQILTQEIGDKIKVWKVAIPMLIVAGTIEAFVSPTGIRVVLKFAISGALLVLLNVYLFGAGKDKTLGTM